MDTLPSSCIFRIGDQGLRISEKYFSPSHQGMTAVKYKLTAAKVLVLWNLSALLILAGVIRLSSTVSV